MLINKMLKISAFYLYKQKRFVPKKKYAACKYSRLGKTINPIFWIVTRASTRNYTVNMLLFLYPSCAVCSRTGNALGNIT